MKKGLFCGLLLITMFSCMKHEDLYNGKSDSEKKKEEFDKNFPVKDIDPEQDWNMAKQVMVNVSVNYGGSGEYTIKMYSDNPRDPEVQAYLLGKYTVKDGSTNALAVDVVSGSESVYVCCVDATDGTVMKWGAIENGKANVSFGAMPKNRAVSGRADEWREFDTAPIIELLDSEKGAFREGQTPSGGAILTSYEFKYNGAFSIYAVGGSTDGQDEIGYYYYTDDINKRKYGTLITNIQNDNSTGRVLEVLDGNSWLSWTFAPESQVGNFAYLLKLNNVKKVRSKACVIDGLPNGCRVGFYVRPNGSQNVIYYSNKALNSGRIHSAVLSRENGTPEYIGLEDNPNEAGRDCNDIVFYIPDSENGTPPEVVDPEKPDKPAPPATWIVACEDLGSTGDYDFNDVVFGVSYVSGTKEATVTPYAAGGTLAATIYCGAKSVGEIHDLLGLSSTKTMINTYKRETEGKPVSVPVGSDFSMSSSMGTFSLVIEGNDEKITSPGTGKAPQMICVPGEWAWPTERTNITAAYPGFGEWGANYNSSKDWWQSPTGSVIK